MPSMVGGVRFGLCTGPGGTGGMAPLLGRFGPPGTARHGRHSACTVHALRRVCRRCGVCADACGCVRTCEASCTYVLADVAADRALDALHVAVAAHVTDRVALPLRPAHGRRPAGAARGC
eukprot:scaffold100842_cov72-Phaeocystis_antarctica.AAC.2